MRASMAAFPWPKSRPCGALGRPLCLARGAKRAARAAQGAPAHKQKRAAFGKKIAIFYAYDELKISKQKKGDVIDLENNYVEQVIEMAISK